MHFYGMVVVCLYECMAAIGTFGLALKPKAFDETEFAKVREAAALHVDADDLADGERAK